MLQVFVQVVLVALGLCKLYTILIRMVKAAQLKLGGFFMCKKLRTVINIMFSQIIFKYIKKKQTLKNENQMKK